MKNITIHFVRVILLLTLYVCCTSVVCCEASKHAVIESSGKIINGVNYNKQTLDEDITPLRIMCIRINELL